MFSVIELLASLANKVETSARRTAENYRRARLIGRINITVNLGAADNYTCLFRTLMPPCRR